MLLQNDSNICVHVPHSGTYISKICKEELIVDKDRLQDELLHMTDWYTNELFGNFNSVVFSISRLVCDVERFLDPVQENMMAKGMGMYYTHSYDNSPIKKNPFSSKSGLSVYAYCLDLYNTHHNQLQNEVDRILSKFDKVILIDAHSFPSVALLYEGEEVKKIARPDICLGMDTTFTPIWLVDLLKTYFNQAGFSVAINTPFAGSLVPISYYEKKDIRIQSIMIEVNRKLYMDEKTGEKNKNFEELCSIVTGLVNVLK